MQEMLGGKIAGPPAFNPLDVKIASAARQVRGQIVAEAEAQGVGVRELARRMHISPSAVSRYLRAEGDVHLSTAVIFADALACEWNFHLAHRERTVSQYLGQDLVNSTYEQWVSDNILYLNRSANVVSATNIDEVNVTINISLSTLTVVLPFIVNQTGGANV